MGFRVLEKVIGQASAPIKFSFTFPRGAAEPRLHLSIAGWLLRRICGEAGQDSQFDCSTAKFTVLIGNEEDFDKVRISHDPVEGDFGCRHAPRGDTYLIKLGIVAEMPNDAMAKKEPVASYEVLSDSETLEIRFPAWVWQKVEPQKALPPPTVVRSLPAPSDDRPRTYRDIERERNKRLGK